MASTGGSNSDGSTLTVAKHQGYLGKKSKVGLRSFFVVLHRGFLIFYDRSADAERDVSRKQTYSLANAVIKDGLKNKFNSSFSDFSFSVKLKSGKVNSFIVIRVDKKVGPIKTNMSVFNKRKRGRALETAEIKNVSKEFKWLSAFREQIEYASRIEQLEQMGEGALIGDIETLLMTSKHKPNLSSQESAPNSFSRSLGLSLSESAYGTDSLLDSSLSSELYDTADEYEADGDRGSFDRRYQSGRPSESDSKSNPTLTPENAQVSTLNHTWRTSLPAKTIDRSQISLWTIAKQLIGKDLSSLSVPVVMCEPLSLMQRIGESLEYCGLTAKAVRCRDDPCKRMEFVAAVLFTVTSSFERLTIPFIPVMGETYELRGFLAREDLGFRMVAEKVVIQPPTCAYYTESLESDAKWTLWGSSGARYRFTGRSIEVISDGLNALDLIDLNERYILKPVPFYLRSLVFGTPWIEHKENLEITCEKTGYKTVFFSKPISNRPRDTIEGYIYDKNMKKVKAVFGNKQSSFFTCEADSFDNFINSLPDVDSPNGKIDQVMAAVKASKASALKDLTQLWKVKEKPPNCSDYYDYNYFALSLNELTDELERTLPPTDSRFRKDVRLMEEGNIEAASEAKHRIEHNERSIKHRYPNFKPLWFKPQKIPALAKEDLWTFTNEYWNRDYSKCPDLY